MNLQWHFTLQRAIFLKNLENTTFEVKMSYCVDYDIWIIRHFLARPNMNITLLKFITTLCETDNLMQNIPIFNMDCGKYST